jgi:HD-GYP domain-containing protein (c-di-GMP phosphodiesterase class II)
MHYAVILADILIISSVGFIAIKLNKRKRRKRELINKNKPDMEIFRGSPDRLERSKKERLNGGVESHFSDISKKESIVRTDFSKHINVGIFSVIIGHELGIENYKTLFIGWLLHDIGKTLIPFSILYKPGKLNEKEFEVIKKHTLLGAHFLFKNGMLDPYILDIVRSHHIYCDGSGYPNSLNKKASNLAQIVTISDAFEAMCSKRVYSEGKTLEEARKELIKEKGKQFNPDLVDVFLEKMAEFYPLTQEKR